MIFRLLTTALLVGALALVGCDGGAEEAEPPAPTDGQVENGEQPEPTGQPDREPNAPDREQDGDVATPIEDVEPNQPDDGAMPEPGGGQPR